MDGNTYAVGVVHDGTAVSVTESLTQIEIEIVNKIGIVHNNLNFDGCIFRRIPVQHFR